MLGAILFVALWSSGGGGGGGDVQPVSLCKSDWTKCTDNADLVNNYSGWSYAQVACESEANGLAQYGKPVWPWMSFSTFNKGTEYAATGTAILIERDAQFQNQFGAIVNSRVICNYDLSAGFDALR